jgi:hypothetical protein
MKQKRQGWVFWPEWTVDQFWSALWRHVKELECYKLSPLQNPIPGGVQRSKLFWIDEATGKESLLCDIEVSVNRNLPRVDVAAGQESLLCEAEAAVKEGHPWVELRMPLGIEAEDAKKAESFWRFFCQAEDMKDPWGAQAEFGMTWRDEIEWMKQLRIEPTEEFQRTLEAMRVSMWDVFGIELAPGVKAADEQAEPQADSGAVAEQLTPAEDEDSSLIKILFLAANPVDRHHLRLEAEMRDIDLALQQIVFRDRFNITSHGAVRAADLQGYLLRHKPDIVHFSGHGDPSSEIVLEDSSGKSHPVSVRALSKLFSVLKDNVRCVVLNACYSEQQAKAIAEHIDCVIGMSEAIGDEAAISFAIAFYQALGYGKSVKTAFDSGRNQIDLENLGEQDTPKLLALNDDPKTVVFAHNSSR